MAEERRMTPIHSHPPGGTRHEARASGSTKSDPPSLVTLTTNSTIDFLAGPSFQDGSASAAYATVVTRASADTSAIEIRFYLRVTFMMILL